MADHSHDRDYGEALRRLGIKNPGDVRVRDPIQLVAVLDDLREVTEKLLTPRVGVRWADGGAVGDFSGVEVFARQHPVVIEQVILGASGTGVTVLFTDPQGIATRLDALRTPLAPIQLMGDPVNMSAQVAVGRANAAPPVNAYGRDASGFFALECEFVIRPGERFYAIADTAAQPVDGAIIYREIPRRSR